MSLSEPPSPVAPNSGSRLWSVGGPALAAIVIMLAVAAGVPKAAPWLIAGAVLVGIVGLTWGGPSGSTAGGTTTAPVARDPSDGSAELLKAAFESLAEPTLLVAAGDADDLTSRRVVMANAAARDLLRIPAQGALLLSAVRDPDVLEALDEALFGGLSRLTDYPGAGGRDRHWRAWTRPLASPNGPCALLTLRDETDVRRMEMMRVDFLANASHELRTPLASLAGFIETLKGHARDDVVARDRFLDIMAVQAERMSRLVADLLSLSRIELNEHIPPTGRADLSRAARDVIDALSVLSMEKGVALTLDAPEPATIEGDRDEVVQVIQNLTDNAIKYSERGQTVEITVRTRLALDVAPGPKLLDATRMSLAAPDRRSGARYAVVTVRDYGPGMAREHLPRLTERFYRVEGQKSGGERAGTGLGLAIVRHIVQRHGGGMTVESAPGEGAAFSVYLPEHQRSAT